MPLHSRSLVSNSFCRENPLRWSEVDLADRVVAVRPDPQGTTEFFSEDQAVRCEACFEA
jgi:hypothetical protein